MVQSRAVSELDDVRTGALQDAVKNLRAFAGVSDEAAAVFYRRFDAFLEEFGGQESPDDLSVWGFLGFMLCQMALDEQDRERG